MRRSMYFGIACSVFLAKHVGAADAPQSGGESGTWALDEIVVTAQKRAQPLQDVPIAVSAIAGDTLSARGIQSSDELSVSIPDLDWQKNLNAQPYIRGIGSRITTAGNQSSVPIYVDGVLQISPLEGNFNLYDVDRIEVLKGPQGTLFGRNANGGVISVITRDPTREPTADVSLGYANFQTVDATFYGSTALGPNLAGNLFVDYHDQGEGWGRNIFNGAQAYRDRSYDIRSKLKFDSGNGTDATLTGEYHYVWSNANANSMAPGTFGFDGTGSPGFYNLNSDWDTHVITQVSGINLRVNHDLDFGKFVSISAYTRVRTQWPFDSDAVPSNILEGPIWERADGATQEFQLVSKETDPLKWIVGVYLLDTKAAFTPIRLFGSEVGEPSYNVYGKSIDVYGEETAKSAATFGEMTYEFLPKTHVTVGGRMTYDHHTVTGHTDVNLAPGAVTEQSQSWHQPTYRLTLDTSPIDDVMLYATASSGYNSGQFNTGNAAAPAVKPEKMRAYEVGFKSEYLDHRVQLNGAAYYYDYTDLQVTITQNAVTLQTNAASAKVKGAELELTVAPVKNMTVGASAAYTDAYYAKYENAQVYLPLPTGGYTPAVEDVTGRALILAPKSAASVFAEYEIHNNVGSFIPAVNFGYKSRFFWDYQNAYPEPSHSVVNASLTFRPPSKGWSLQLWGKNLSNEEIRAAGLSRLEGEMSAPAAPRTYGLTVTAHY
jgi:iron complex outermembrane receptor protein